VRKEGAGEEGVLPDGCAQEEPDGECARRLGRDSVEIEHPDSLAVATEEATCDVPTKNSSTPCNANNCGQHLARIIFSSGESCPDDADGDRDYHGDQGKEILRS